MAISIISIIVATNLLLEVDCPSQEGATPPPRHHHLKARLLLTLAIFLVAFFGIQHQRELLQGHPIDYLINSAKQEHTQWAQQAHQSASLDNAIRVYRRRYGRHPPPGYDRWYAFAVERDSIVIDDFDNIENDLAPFWSLSPAQLRRRTAEILTDSEHLGGVSIRGGKAHVFSSVPDTHRWSMDGIIRMIEPFVEHLPDMDFAVNLNDEPRVAVPYPFLQGAHDQRISTRPTTSIDSFSSGRASTWFNASELSGNPSYFSGVPFLSTFQRYGSISCPPSSRARTERHWNTAVLCQGCSAPHSWDMFVHNWTLSASPCHQPDIANLHGVHLSPSSFLGTQDILPVFSQSKPLGYADIRFPSPWNYMEKTRYFSNEDYPDPPFENKENTLFWRGTTSEGVSAGSGAWKGMLRQRLVHLLNARKDQKVVILLPKDGSRFQYAVQSSLTMSQRLETKLDVRFVAPIVRCGGADCSAQREEFELAEPVDFNQHWRYKYLFDADGAGFSGRFIPFLQSNSLVFKSAIFREWFEGRLSAWHHFVPVDLRLHDLWSILAYFGGLKGPDGKTSSSANDSQAKAIADQGKTWANKVLRKEDMEIYMYRLLLEWAWLTDDQRAVQTFA